MAIASLVLDGTRHIDNNGFTRCGKLIPYGTPWEQDPADEKPEGKLCKTCYATIEAEEDAKADQDAAMDAQTVAPHASDGPDGVQNAKAAKTAKKG